MPLYVYTCPECGAVVERIVSLLARDDQTCDNVIAEVANETPLTCRGALVREQIADSQVNRVDKRWQVGARLGNGAVVPGHFGTSAKKWKGFGP